VLPVRDHPVDVNAACGRRARDPATCGCLVGLDLRAAWAGGR